MCHIIFLIWFLKAFINFKFIKLIELNNNIIKWKIFQPCQKKITLRIPKKFIHNGEPTAEQWIDIGVLNLESTFAVEERECLH